MAHPQCLDASTSCLVVIDIQEKFSPAIAGFDTIVANAQKLVAGCRLLGSTVIATEQYPRGLGSTVEALKAELDGCPIFEKTSFSCTGAEGFMERLQQTQQVKNILLCGVETHVCVSQTALALIDRGYQVHLILDAIGSRKSLDHETALRSLERAGAILSTVEIALFGMLGGATHPKFRDVQRLVK